MDLLKNGQCPRGRPVELEEGVLRLSREVECLEGEKVGCVMVSVELLEGVVLVTERAAHTIHADLPVVEGRTVLGLELGVEASLSSLCELMLAMGKPTLVFIVAFAVFDPVLANLGLVFAVGGVLLHHVHHHLVVVNWVGALAVVAWDEGRCSLLIAIEGLSWGSR